MAARQRAGSHPPLTDGQIASRYSKAEMIGSGSFKIVYRAYDNVDGVEVAWNEVRLGKYKEVEVRRIYQEVKLLSELNHPSILKLHAAWTDKEHNCLIFITEFFTNGTIHDYIEDVVRQPTRSVVSKWCRQILEGLNYIHSHDPPVIHRDLKLDNIFIDAAEGVCKLGDFGLARAIPTGEAESKLGTPAFTAPEVYQGKYTTKADIWSFGLCVLAMVTGLTPYDCPTLGAIVAKVTSGQLPPQLTRIQDQCVADFISLCLVPQDRRPDASELLEHPLITQYAVDSASDDQVGSEWVPTADQGDFQEPLDDVEYQGLLTQQRTVVDEMKRRHRAERRALRRTLRERRG